MKKTISVILAVFMLALTALPCFAGSYTCTAYGDVNVDSDKVLLNDGVTVDDARLILRYSIGLDPFSSTRRARADLDANGKVNVADARLALRIALGKDTQPDHPITVVDASLADPDAADSEYNILGTEKYVIKASVPSTGTTSSPMLIARNGENVYIEINYSGISLGLMVKDGKTYMISTDRKYSLELTDDICNAMDDLNEDEHGTMKKDMASMTDPSSYSFLCPDLDTATSVEGEKITCPLCGTEISTGETVYTFGEGSNRYEVYMNGKELIKTVEYKNGVKDDEIDFDYVSADVPDSYFALPTKSANRYPTTLVSGQTAIITFLLKVVDMDELLNS